MVVRVLCLGLFYVFGVYGDAPIQLVRPVDGYTRLETVDEGMAFLRSLPDPIAVISAVGAIHSGKSFLLNQLSDSTDGFSVGYTVRPETHGIWAIKYNGKVVSKFSSGKLQEYAHGPPDDTTVLFLDTEGLFSKDASSSYDARLFAITTLLSSEVIYNTVKFIDTHHMEALETLIRRTNLFGLRAYAAARGGQERVSSLSEFLRLLVPSHLSWVVQDFVQDLENREPEAWLQQLLSQEKVNSPGAGGASGVIQGDGGEDNYGSQVNSFFKSIDCITLPIPATSHELLQKLDTVCPDDLEPNYRAGISTFRSRLLRRASNSPKLKSATAGGMPMSGTDLADLLTFLVEASNGAANYGPDDSPFPEIESVAEQFVKLQLKLMQSDILTIVERDLKKVSMRQIALNLPMGNEAFENELDKQAEQAAKLWNATITGVVHHKSLSGPVNDAEKNFLTSLESAKEELRKMNSDMVRVWCTEFVTGLLDELRDTIHEQVAGEPKPIDELHMLIAKAESPIRQKYRQTIAATGGLPEACNSNEGRFVNQINEVRASLESENEQLLKKSIDEANKAALVKFQNCAKDAIVNLSLITLPDLREKLGACRRHALDEIDFHVNRYPGVSVIQVRRSEATNRIEGESQRITDEWAALCSEKAVKFIARAQRNLQLEVRRMVPFPADSEELNKSLEYYSNDWRNRYRKEVICSGTEAGRIHDAALEAVIAETRVTIEHANIQALREIHGHSFKELREKLELRLNEYYWWPTLSADAEKMALATLRLAWNDFHAEPNNRVPGDPSSGEEPHQRKEFSESLMRKTANTFVTDDLYHAHLQLNMAVFTRQTALAFGIGLLIGGLNHRSHVRSLIFVPLGVGAAALSSISLHMSLAEKIPLGWVPENPWAAVFIGISCGAGMSFLCYIWCIKPAPRIEKIPCDVNCYPMCSQRNSCPQDPRMMDPRSPNMRETSHRFTMGY